jgi:hypothetical protein
VSVWLGCLCAGGFAVQESPTPVAPGGGAPTPAPQDGGRSASDPSASPATDGDEPDEPEAEAGGGKESAAKRRAEREAKRRERRAKKEQPVANAGERFVEIPAPGAGPGQMRFFDAECDAKGIRRKLDPIKDDVAFEVWIDGLSPRTRVIEEPDPENPGATRAVGSQQVVSVLEVTNAEWDDYFGSLKRFTPPGDDSTFLTVVLAEVLEQKAMMLRYRDDLADVARRAEAAVAKLKAGTPFKDVVRAHTEDDISLSADGLVFESDRGELLPLYPFSKVAFDLEQPGDIAGPFFNKQAAYILMVDKITRSTNAPWHDKVRAKGVVLRYPNGPNLKAQEIGTVKAGLRVRTDQEPLRRVLPPGRQEPPPLAFGPDDVAPLGQPDAPLRRRHISDERDQQVDGG